jgi:hypothetical protein
VPTCDRNNRFKSLARIPSAYGASGVCAMFLLRSGVVVQEDMSLADAVVCAVCLYVCVYFV